MKTISKKTIFAASIGNLLEMYAFSLYTLFLPILSPIFFPSSDPFASLLLGYLVFAVGFFAYPFGALFFGFIGDVFGRKTALSFSLLGIALSTFLIGILPSYFAIGLLSPLLLSLFRTIQGLCAGGECIGSGMFIIEHTLRKYPSFFGSIAAASGTFGALVASIFSNLVVWEFLPHWAWRLLFIVSILIGIVGTHLRRSISESPDFNTSCSKKWINPIKEILKFYKLPFVMAIGVGALGTVPFYMVIGFLNNYLVTLEKISFSNSLQINFLLLLFCALTLPLAGYTADKISIYKAIVFSALFSFLYSYPFFYLIHSGSLFVIVGAELLLLSLSQFYVAPLNAFLNQTFPTHVRYTGASFGYCIGMALFGGTSPYISLAIIKMTGIKTLPSLYLAFVSFVGLSAVMIGRKQEMNSLEKMAPAY